ncbi:MAG: hypothetical protein NWE93_06645 [Candidatus Bathyarchaeota archaeon]|nr:hypothetical protein [Candidatus Bathyarchaeota archaeon]
MEKTRIERVVELENDFQTVWTILWKVGTGVDLETEEGKKSFVARAKHARRVGCSEDVAVLVFFKRKSDGEVKECSRCYSTDWGLYFNSFGVAGQRIGMYTKVVDCWVTQKSLTLNN